MIQPASFFSSITPVKAYSSDSLPPASARPGFRATENAQPLLERIAREPQVKRDSLDTRHEARGEPSQNVQDFIDTILTNGEFLPVTHTPQEPVFSADGRSPGQSFSGPATGTEQAGAVAPNAPTMAGIRAAAEAWQQTEPQRLNTSGLPSAVATYLNVQSGGTPALGLSLLA